MMRNVTFLDGQFESFRAVAVRKAAGDPIRDNLPVLT